MALDLLLHQLGVCIWWLLVVIRIASSLLVWMENSERLVLGYPFMVGAIEREWWLDSVKIFKRNVLCRVIAWEIDGCIISWFHGSIFLSAERLLVVSVRMRLECVVWVWVMLLVGVIGSSSSRRNSRVLS